MRRQSRDTLDLKLGHDRRIVRRRHASLGEGVCDGGGRIQKAASQAERDNRGKVHMVRKRNAVFMSPVTFHNSEEDCAYVDMVDMFRL